MADGIVIVGLDGIIRFANPAAEHLFGRSADELRGTEFGVATLTGDSTEIEVVRPGGETVAVELRVVRTDWEESPVYLVSLRDVTDRRRAEERTAQLENERLARVAAEASNRAKSEFLAVMSHELRTPLNAVIGYADLLDLGIAGAINSEQRLQVERIRASGRHLLGLVNEVLDLARADVGRLSLHITRATARAAGDAALSLVQPSADARGVRLSPACLGDGEALYEGDEDRVRQILVNLLNNAVKFTDAGGSVALECGATTRPDDEARLASGSWVFFRVIDSGIGIPREQLSTIFDPFVQADSGHTRRNEGSGLGLTISRRLARLMKGDLTARSVLGRGSTFTLWLPAVTTDAGPHDVAPVADAAVRLYGLAEIGEALVRELEPLITTFADRLRREPLIPHARLLGFAQLADHVGSYVADIGGILIAVEESRGQPSSLLADGAEIQRVVAERHGAQRARLGWTVDALRREWQVLSDEIERAIRRRVDVATDATVNDALAIVRRILEQSELLSCRALTRTLGELRDAGGRASRTPAPDNPAP